MTCLICHNNTSSKRSFTKLLLLKESNSKLCQNCRNEFVKIEEIHCPNCYKNGAVTTCPDCQLWFQKGKTVHHQALYQYNEAMKSYIKTYKFSGDYLLREVFTPEIKRVLRPFERSHQLIPIPLSQKNFETRGFNQVTGFLDVAGIKYSDILDKKETEKQSSKTREERLKATQPFLIKESAVLEKKVIIIDDIYTTGATIQLATEILEKAGAQEILSFSLAR